MTTNDVLRRVRYIFDLNDAKMIAVFALAGREVSRGEVSAWLKKDEDSEFQECPDIELATFLNGLITEKRGAKDGATPEAESVLPNNLILLKLKIALTLRAEDIIGILNLAGLRLSKPELSAFFRKKNHPHYRQCKDQVLRNFLQGLQMKMRGDGPSTASSVWTGKRPR